MIRETIFRKKANRRRTKPPTKRRAIQLLPLPLATSERSKATNHIKSAILRITGADYTGGSYSLRNVQVLPPSLLDQVWLSEVFTRTVEAPAMMATMLPVAAFPRCTVSQVVPASREWTRAAWLPPAHTSFPRAVTKENSMLSFVEG